MGDRRVAGHGCNVGSRCAVKRCVGDAARRQEVRSQSSHAKLGHIGHRLTDAAAEQKAAQLLVQAGHVQVPDKGFGGDASETHPETLPEGNLQIKKQSKTSLE